MFSNECGPMRLKEIGGGSAEAGPSEIRVSTKKAAGRNIEAVDLCKENKAEQGLRCE